VNVLLLDLLLRWSVWAAVCQLVGTALIVWGLKVTTDTGTSFLLLEDSKAPLPHAGIVREHPRALRWGIRLLLFGLVLQVVAAVR
jgi:hypothetical protein